MMAPPDPASPEIQLLDLEKRFREIRAVDGVSLEVGSGEFFSLLGPSGCGKTTTLRHDRRLRAADRWPDPAPRPRRHNGPARQAAGQHGVPELRPLPAPRCRRQRRLRAEAQGRRQGRDEASGWRCARARAPGGVRTAAPKPAVGRTAAARGPGPGAGQSTQRAAARRAPRGARSQAPAPAPARAQADPDRGRDHVRLRDPRPGGGAHDERPDRGHARGQGRAAGDAGGTLRASGEPLRGRLHRDHQPAPRTGRRRTAASASRRGRWSG